MTLAYLIRQEIRYRNISFLASTAAVAVAGLAVLVAEGVLMRDAIETAEILSRKQAETSAAIAAKMAAVAAAGHDLEDSIRKQMLGLGFNVLILPAAQDPTELHLQGSLTETLPEQYVQRLANSRIITVNHLLPTVMKKISWPEQKLDLILYGTRGEIPIMHRSLKKPLLDAVAPGEIVLGYAIHKKLGVKVGDRLTLLGREFRVSRLHPERGSTDDVTAWIDLAAAQELLGMANRIHAILALECECTGDRIGQVREEITGLLPGTQVIERYSQALARAEARSKAKQVAMSSLQAEQHAAEETLTRERRHRQEIEQRHQHLVMILLPVVFIVSAMTVGLLAAGNVRSRREEIGIFRALGFTTRQVLLIFLGKAALTGILGGVLAILIGSTALMLLTPPVSSDEAMSALDTRLMILKQPGMLVTLLSVPVIALLLAVLASTIPAILAAKQDAAKILQQE